MSNMETPKNLISKEAEKRRRHLNLSMGMKIGLVALILIFFNLVMSRLYFRVDLTENSQYSLSAATKKKLKSLDDRINIEAYFSDELPEKVQAIRNQLRDLLEEFRARSNGKIQYTFINPGEDFTLKEKLRRRGIPEVSLNVFEKDKAAVSKAYMGMSILFQDKVESVPVIESVQTMEYRIMAALIKLSSKEQFTIGYTVGKGEKELEKDLPPLANYLREQYKLEKVDLSQGKVAEQIKALIVLGPTEKFEDKDIFYLDQFVVRGGKLFLALDQVVEDQNQRSARGRIVNHNLDAFLAHLGVRFEKNLVQDLLCDQAQFRSPFGTLIQAYPLWPKLVKFHKEISIVNQLDSLVLLWASSMSLVPQKGITATPLAYSSPKSWDQKGQFSLDPQAAGRIPDQGTMKEFTMAYMLEGAYSSFFKDRPLPDGVPKNEERANAATGARSQHIVVGDSDFIVYGLQNRRQAGNRNFFLNSLDFLTLGQDLIGIRSKQVNDRPLLPLSDDARQTIKYLTILIMPLIVILIGSFRFMRRRSMKRMYESMQKN